MTQTVDAALAAATLYTDQQDYTLLKLPLPAITAAAGIIAEIGEPFCTLIADKDEVTLVIPAEAFADFQQRLPGHTASPQAYRLITLDVVLEPDLVGFMAHISQALAAVGISILPLAAFTRDHLLVPAEKLNLALQTLESLKAK